MQDIRLNSIEALTSEGPFGSIATLKTGSRRQLGYVASRPLSGGLFGGLVVVSLVGILIIRSSG